MTRMTNTATTIIVQRASGSFTLLRRRDGTESVWRTGIPSHDEAVRRAHVLKANLGDRIIDKAKGAA